MKQLDLFVTDTQPRDAAAGKPTSRARITEAYRDFNRYLDGTVGTFITLSYWTDSSNGTIGSTGATTRVYEFSSIFDEPEGIVTELETLLQSWPEVRVQLQGQLQGHGRFVLRTGRTPVTFNVDGNAVTTSLPYFDIDEPVDLNVDDHFYVIMVAYGRRPGEALPGQSLGGVYTQNEGSLVFVRNDSDVDGTEMLQRQLATARLPIVIFYNAAIVTGQVTVLSATQDSIVVDAIVKLDADDDWQCALVSSKPDIRAIESALNKRLQLTSRFQHVVAAELLCYTITGLAEDVQFVGLQIDELPGRTLSTNRVMEHMFAVLPKDQAGGSTVYVPAGMMKVEYEHPILSVKTITPRLLDSNGDVVAHTSMRLWLRLTVLDK